MPKTLAICLKATAEYFDIPYHGHTTIDDLIESVCAQSTVLSNTNPDDYYMVINKSDMLDGNRTVKETDLNQSDRCDSLDVYIKTRVLAQRILQSHMELWQISAESVSKKARQTAEIDKSSNIDRTLSSTNQQQVLTTTEAVSNDYDFNSEVHILICGGPKVGKSTLINALCGCPVAKTNTIGLDQCTKRTTSYQLDNIYFWDTPGIQQWSNLDIDSYLKSFTPRQTPLCMFYCASPGSFTKLKQLDILLDECIRRRHIFCVLVVTNMYANVNRDVVLGEFKTLLSKYVDHNHQIKEKHGVWYYGQVGLCTMVNSQEYVFEATNRIKPQQGINELVLALTKSFSETHHLGSWLQTIKQNRQFWLDNQEELYKLTEKPHEICLSEMI